VNGLTPNSDISLDYAQRDLARVAWGQRHRLRFYKLDPFAYDFHNTDNNHYPVIRLMQGTTDQGAAYHFVPATILLLSDPNPEAVRYFGLAEWSQAQAFLDTLALTDDQLAMMINELKLRACPNRADWLKSLLMALTRGRIVAVLIYDDITPPKRKGPEDLPVEEYTPKPYTLGPHEEPGYEPPPQASKTKLKLKNLQQMDHQFVGEETGAVWGTKVKYLNVDERLHYQVQIKDGKLFDAQGNLFDTASAHSAFGGSGNAIFIMDESGNIYASTVHSVGKFHHSSFLSGQPVASAGEIVVEQGIVKEVTRRSGHYQPTAEQLNQFLDRLNKSGIDLSNVNVGAGF